MRLILIYCRRDPPTSENPLALIDSGASYLTILFVAALMSPYVNVNVQRAGVMACLSLRVGCFGLNALLCSRGGGGRGESVPEKDNMRVSH